MNRENYFYNFLIFLLILWVGLVILDLMIPTKNEGRFRRVHPRSSTIFIADDSSLFVIYLVLRDILMLLVDRGEEFKNFFERKSEDLFGYLSKRSSSKTSENQDIKLVSDSPEDQPLIVEKKLEKYDSISKNLVVYEFPPTHSSPF